MKEHERERVHLTFLGDAVNRLLRGFNTDDLEMLKSSLSYLDSEVRDHCRREEMSVYPKLLAVVSQTEIFEMKYEHEKIDESLTKLGMIIQNFNDLSLRDINMVKLKVDAKNFVQLLTSHIGKEDSYFLLMAKRVLSEREIYKVFKLRKEIK